MATWLFVQHIMQANTNEISFCDGIPPVGGTELLKLSACHDTII